jgi:hypothetical protein
MTRLRGAAPGSSEGRGSGGDARVDDGSRVTVRPEPYRPDVVGPELVAIAAAATCGVVRRSAAERIIAAAEIIDASRAGVARSGRHDLAMETVVDGMREMGVVGRGETFMRTALSDA